MVQGIYQLQPVASAGDTMVLTIDLGGDRKRIGLGEPGDQLILGDWDCDDVDTPGLYKPAGAWSSTTTAGRRWPTRRTSPTRSETVDTGGRAEVAEGNGSRCDRIRSGDDAGESSGSVPEAEPVTGAATSAGGPRVRHHGER